MSDDLGTTAGVPMGHPPHEFALLLPPLTGDEFAALTESIKEYGVINPITLDDAGLILDGVHRDRVCARLGIDCPVNQVPAMSEEKKLRLAFGLNFRQRTLDPERRRALVARLSTERGMSIRRISRATGWSKSQVQRDLKPQPGTDEDRPLASWEADAEECGRLARVAALRYAASEMAKATAHHAVAELWRVAITDFPEGTWETWFANHEVVYVDQDGRLQREKLPGCRDLPPFELCYGPEYGEHEKKRLTNIFRNHHDEWVAGFGGQTLEEVIRKRFLPPWPETVVAASKRMWEAFDVCEYLDASPV
jgi:ParB-like chromosome segregation protein Spo0J